MVENSLFAFFFHVFPLLCQLAFPEPWNKRKEMVEKIIPKSVDFSLPERENRAMTYMDVKTASELWGITGRRIRILCNDGRIDGAVRNGWSWMIPVETAKPRDGRVLRRFKSMDIRPGTVDVEKLDHLKEIADRDTLIKGFKPSQRILIARTLECLFKFEGIDISVGDIMKVLNGELSYHLTLKEHLLIVNFTSIIKSLDKNPQKWTEGSLRDTYVRLMQGIEDVSGEYREGFVHTRNNQDGVRVSVAMETVMAQYEASWSKLHGVVSAVILAGEISRIRPYDKYRFCFYYLIYAGELYRNGFIPIYLDGSCIDEAKAAYSLVFSKGVYRDVTALVERLLIRTYGELGYNV